MGDVQDAQLGVKRSDDGSLVEFGIALANGGFFPFAASRSGDYDEAVAADAQPQPQPEAPSEPPAPQPDSPPVETAPPAPEQPVEGG